MQISDPWFLLAFLPVCLLLYHTLGRISRAVAASILTAASLAFYAFSGVAAACILVADVALNYGFARAILGSKQDRRRTAMLWIGVAANVATLAYFKYTGFLLMNFAALTGGSMHAVDVLLPLGISFSTFQRIALLVDVYRGRVSELPVLDYALFSCFFPCAACGPITRGREMLPQIRDLRAGLISKEFVAGLSIFVVGLAKKVLIADSLQVLSSQVFDAYGFGEAMDPLKTWVGVLAYSLQIYYDFSGYSEMALGLAKMVGLRLPVNFNSPYKANSIIGFWNRWHMTLSRFLRDYLFTPMSAGSGLLRRYGALVATMLIAGLWHGSQWRFVVWGGLHGAYLVVNHVWREIAERSPELVGRLTSKKMKPVGRLLTFAAVTVAWVFFRAADMPTAGAVARALFGVGCPALRLDMSWLRDSFLPLFWVAVVLALTFRMPDTIAIFSGADPCIEKMPVTKARPRWVPTWRSAVVIGIVAFLVFRAYFSAAEMPGFTYSNF